VVGLVRMGLRFGLRKMIVEAFSGEPFAKPKYSMSAQTRITTAATSTNVVIMRIGSCVKF